MRKLAASSALVLALFSLSATPKPQTRDSEAEVRQLLGRWEKAFRAKDVDGVMAVYASGNDWVAYDIVPPLQVAGAGNYRKNYAEFFAQYEGPLDFEFRDLKIVAGGDVAFVHSLERVTGTLKGGQKSDLWMRATSGLQKRDGKWRIVHDHISVPADFATGKALLELKP